MLASFFSATQVRLRPEPAELQALLAELRQKYYQLGPSNKLCKKFDANVARRGIRLPIDNTERR
jgi:hypothetical protein